MSEGEYLPDVEGHDENKLNFLTNDTTPAAEDAMPNLPSLQPPL